MSTDSKLQGRTVCRHVRSKESFHSVSPLVEDQFHSGVYWCDLTADALGPDGRSVDAEECCRGRACFEA